MNFKEIKQLIGIKRNEMKFTDKDYMFSDYFPNDLLGYTLEKRERIEELKNTFLLESNIALELANRFIHGELKDLNTCALKEELGIHKGNKALDISGKIHLMHDLNTQYERLTGERCPCYDQYVNHSWVVTSELEKEIKSRKIEKLEKRFSKQSNQSFVLYNKIRKGELDRMDNKALCKLYNEYEKRTLKIDSLMDYYCKLIGEKSPYSTPDHSKHLQYSNEIFADLDLEIIFRDGELNGDILK